MITTIKLTFPSVTVFYSFCKCGTNTYDLPSKQISCTHHCFLNCSHHTVHWNSGANSSRITETFHSLTNSFPFLLPHSP